MRVPRTALCHYVSGISPNGTELIPFPINQVPEWAYQLDRHRTPIGIRKLWIVEHSTIVVCPRHCREVCRRLMDAVVEGAEISSETDVEGVAHGPRRQFCRELRRFFV